MNRFIPGWAIPLLIVFAFATVWLRLNVFQSTIELNQMNKTLNNVKLDHERLELRVAQLRSPRKLESLARNKFNLQPPTADRMIQLKE
jgi:cell division protein FtsL